VTKRSVQPPSTNPIRVSFHMSSDFCLYGWWWNHDPYVVPISLLVC